MNMVKTTMGEERDHGEDEEGDHDTGEVVVCVKEK